MAMASSLLIFPLKKSCLMAVSMVCMPKAREAAALPVTLPESGLSLEEVEKELILRALQKHDWNQSRAARYLGITRHTLLYRMEKHHIVRPGDRTALGDEEPQRGGGSETKEGSGERGTDDAR